MIFEKLIDRLIEKIPKEYSEMEKARYLYINLAKIFTFDENYYLGNSKMQKQIVLRSNKESIGKREIVLNKKNKAVCISIAKAYCYALNKIGIEAHVCQYNPDDPHVSTLFYVEGKSYIADLQLDLLYVQMGRKTRFFGKGYANEDLPDEEIERIDEKIGYNYKGENEVSKKLKMLQEKCKGIKTFFNRVNLIIEELKDIDCLKDMGLVEVDAFYSWTFKRIFTIGEYKNIRKNFIYSKDEEGNRSVHDYYLTVLNSENNPNRTYDRYEFDREKMVFNKISEEVFRKKIKGKLSAKNEKILGIREKKANKKVDNNGDFEDK